ncbi:MAG: DUF6802 family protein [Pseudonocardiaceae bacterium]
MYIEDQAGTDLTVTVGEEEYEAEATHDMDSDGVDDSVMVQHDDGSALAFSDTDGDGRADLMTQIDARGGVTGRAEFDPRTGEWIGMDPSAGDESPMDDTSTMGGGGEPITVEKPDGEMDAGRPTHDTDGDGVKDTVVIADKKGGTMIFTDVDGDGSADYATEITSDGEVTMTQHAGDGEWTVVGLDAVGWGPDPDAGEPATSVDPVTGRWVNG